MIQLTDRLQRIAGEIEPNETVADIGTDHGLLPISLWEQGISPKVIMADISPDSLQKARSLARETHPAQTFDFRVGDGIKPLQKGEVDVVVLAGMGGALMCSILSREIEKTRSFGKWIFQPRIGQGTLRKWLLENGFGIAKESLVREGKYICEIITAFPNRTGLSPKPASEIEYEVPTWMIHAGPLAEEFISRKRGREEKILAGLKRSKSFQAEKIRQTEDNISYLERLLKEIQHGNQLK